MGTNVFGPTKHIIAPVLEIESPRYPAKLASTNNANTQFCGESPTQHLALSNPHGTHIRPEAAQRQAWAIQGQALSYRPPLALTRQSHQPARPP